MRRLQVTSESITRKETTSIKKYLHDLSRIPLLTPDQEYELSYLAFENNDEKSRELLIKHNLRFVVTVAKQYQTKGLELEDLINEGNIGLIIASQKFDPSKGFKFISYAVWWIRRNIIAYIAENSKMIRIPANKTTVNYKINQKCRELEQILQHEPTFYDIMRECGDMFTEEDVLFYFESLYSNIASLDKKVGDTSSSETLCNLIQDDTVIDPSHFVKELDLKYERSVILNSLKNDVERKVIELLYGLDGKQATTLKDTGFLLGRSSERIRQIRDNALKTLRKVLCKKNRE
jgi:RNA polymerase primary sigma factor